MEARKFNPNDHLIQLKGKDYLQVMWRLVWFREEKPLWAITTQMIAHDTEAKHCIFKAEILDENGLVKSTGTGSESIKDFGDYIEKAETKAVGRALAMLGYGTQFAPELDEGDRIVDSPTPAKPDPERAQYLKAIAASGVDARLIDASCMKRYKKPLEKLTTEQLAEVAVLMAQNGAENAGA